MSSLMVLAKFQGLKAADINLGVMKEFAGALGFETPDEEGLAGIAQRIMIEQPDDLVAFMSTEENVVELVGAIRGKTPPPIWKCPHCGLLSLQ